ncbi:DNA helicase [Aeromonas phage vB_AhyS-A18P4]|uniref:ATP-dependent helicase n=1 Tax=Aeromonas phage vB_AhyS-A18P4 TaxID=2608321 RepID=A0A5J6T290_9CAUD|nr:DNA helicase [Aeromonas phage vB_AhyS-A18P4]QFG04469.1 ATP-dependent helicase [Aeromonas phage vB_AhyS-A18P4]
MGQLYSGGTTSLPSVVTSNRSVLDLWWERITAEATLDREQMHDYQVEGADFIKANPYCACFVDLGLGKTVMSLTAITDLLWSDPRIKKVLVIAPLKVANMTWPDEIRNWYHTCHLDYAVLTGDEASRLHGLRQKVKIYIINRENVEWLVNTVGRRWDFDMVVIDEAANFKDSTTNRFKALAKVRPRIRRVVELTATPVSESYLGLFAMIFLLDRGERFGRKFQDYKDEYFKENRYSRRVEIRKDSPERITDLISDITLVMEAKDYLDLQPTRFIDVQVPLSAKEQARYKEMADTAMIEVLDEAGEATLIEAETAATLTGKLLQMASGFIYETKRVFADELEERVKVVRTPHILHDHKLERLDGILDDMREQNERVVVVYHFKPSLERLMKRYPKARVMDKEGRLVKDWNEGKIDLLFLHAQSAGHGLNMQKGGRVMVFFDLPWSLDLYLQVIGRLARQGQLYQVLVYHLIAKGTDDGRVVERLREKRDTQDWLFARLKRLAAKRKREMLKRIAALAEEDDDI